MTLTFELQFNLLSCLHIYFVFCVVCLYSATKLLPSPLFLYNLKELFYIHKIFLQNKSNHPKKINLLLYLNIIFIESPWKFFTWNPKFHPCFSISTLCPLFTNSTTFNRRTTLKSLPLGTLSIYQVDITSPHPNKITKHSYFIFQQV